MVLTQAASGDCEAVMVMVLTQAASGDWEAGPLF